MPDSITRLRSVIIGVVVCIAIGVALFVACSNMRYNPTVTPTPTRTPRPTPTPTPTLTPTPAWPVTVFIPFGLPEPAALAVQSVIDKQPDLFRAVESEESADVQVVFDARGEASPLAEWVFALVAPFPTVVDDVAWVDIVQTWTGNASGPLGAQKLLVARETAATLAHVLGDPAPDAIELVSADAILDTAWQSQPSWAIVPFEALEPRWKVLRVDGLSVLDRELDTSQYPLAVTVSLNGLDRGVRRLNEVLDAQFTNRDPSEMSVVILTGVTALTRATAVRMERHGPTYPGEDIRDWLLEPDITHLSNEVSFATSCPAASEERTMVFCSDPAYIALLEDLDIDVVELTGNHLRDWGAAAMEFSLSLYDERGIAYYGGGRDVAEAQAPLTKTAGVHTFGFIGCSPPQSNPAGQDSPGAAPCDFGLMAAQITDMRKQGIIPIVTLQYWEYYQYEPTAKQREDFRALAAAGAAIVSGSQAHQPQGFDFHEDAFIHYGLGNLFFDQMWSLATRQEFIDRHVFYAGRHLSTELLTAILEDYSRPRPMSTEERQALLEAAFAASQW
jgi:poly-gamma-glutamate synthesis protein (capsule biosynthesis protein)